MIPCSIREAKVSSRSGCCPITREEASEERLTPGLLVFRARVLLMPYAPRHCLRIHWLSSIGRTWLFATSLLIPLLSTFNTSEWTSLAVQWLRLLAPNAGDLGSIPGQRTRSHMLQPSLQAQLKFCIQQLRLSMAKLINDITSGFLLPRNFIPMDSSSFGYS